MQPRWNVRKTRNQFSRITFLETLEIPREFAMRKDRVTCTILRRSKLRFLYAQGPQPQFQYLVTAARARAELALRARENKGAHVHRNSLSSVRILRTSPTTELSSTLASVGLVAGDVILTRHLSTCTWVVKCANLPGWIIERHSWRHRGDRILFEAFAAHDKVRHLQKSSSESVLRWTLMA